MKDTPLQFSDRSAWPQTKHPLSIAIDARRAEGKPIFDLTRSSIGSCDFSPPDSNTLNALTPPEALNYHPDPQGMLSAREAAADWFKARGVESDAQNIYLTASTSEAYSWCLRLLTNPGDIILTPRPSYPLFAYLADLNDVSIKHYDWSHDGSWHLDLATLESQLCPRTKAIIIVSPNNPTGTCLHPDDCRALCTLAAKHGIAILSDEVFADYRLDPDTPDVSLAHHSDALAFTFGGGSKTLGLPQMKIAWMHISGPSQLVHDARQRLDVIADTYLSVNTPAQLALPSWMHHRHDLHEEVLQRLRRNLSMAQKLSGPESPITVYPVSGGWSLVLRIPSMPDEETTAMALLDNDGVITHPGSFYGFDFGAHLVLSLMTPTADFDIGLAAIKTVCN